MEQKQIFSIRRFKTGTHSALLGKITLGTVAIIASAALAQGVSADETTTAITTNATAVTVQATDNTENKALESQANTSQGSITQPVTSETLNAAVNDAKAEGVDVVEGDKVSHDTLDSAKADLAKQEADVKSATKEKDDNSAEIKKAEDTNAQIKADNQAEKERVAKVNAQGQAAVDQRNAQGQAQTDQINANEKAKADETNAQNDATAKVENDRRDAEYQEKLKEVADVLAYNEGVRKRNEEALAAVTDRNKKAQEEYAKAKAKYDKESASVSLTIEENAKAKAEYEKALAEYTKAKAEYDSQVSSINSQNDEAQAYNKKVMEARGLPYTGDYTKDKATVDYYNGHLSEYATISETNLQKWNEAVANTSPSVPNENGYTPSGSATMLTPVTLSNGVQVVGTGNLTKDGTGVILRGDIDESKVVNEVKWGDVDLEGTGLRTFTPGDNNDIWGNTYDYKTGGATKFFIAKTLTWYRIPNLIKTMDGQSHDGYVLFQSDPSGLHSAYNGSEVAVWNADKAINAIDGGTVGSVNQKSDAIRTIISLDKPDNNDENVIWFNLMSDIDGGQYLDGDYGKLLGLGGGMKSSTSEVASDEELGYSYGINRSGNALNGLSSSPDGTALLVQNGTYSTSLRNTAGGNSAAVARADFGAEGSISKTIIKVTTPTPISIKEVVSNSITPPTPPTPPVDKVVPNLKEPTPPTTETFNAEKEKEVPPTPVEPTHVTPVHVSPKVITFTPETYTPITPTEKPFVKVPETLHVKVSVHPVEVKQEPKITKDVVNTDGVSTDGSMVIKGSTQTWVLHPSLIKGGRPEVKSVEFRDAFPSGFEVDKEASAKLNQQYYTVVYDENGSATVKGNAALLNAVNANPSSDYVLPDIFYVGQPMLANTTFKNTYKQVISFPNGEYVTVSNTPKITTPNVQPKKENRNLDGVDINGKAMTIGATNDYRLTWNLSQYKGAVLTANEIAKGFFFVDDFPEEAVTINEAGMTLTANGKAVEGVSHKVYQSLDELPSNLKETFTKQGIKPKGAFQVFTADNSQAFYDTYVKTGTDIVISDKMVVKDELRGTGASYENTAYQVDFGQGYVTETVKNHVPKVTPLKEDFNSKGVNIGGKSVLAGSVNHYKLTWDLDQYKDMSADKETISKGFFYVDDYPADVVTVLKDQVRIYTVDKDGKEVPVSGVSVHYYDSLSEVPANIAKALTEYGYTPKGKLQVFLADDPQAFYDTYVSKGLNIYVSNPMQVKDEVAKTGAAYENTAIQVDFGKAQGKSTVHNNVPKFEAVKDVKVNGQSVNGGVIQLNEHFSYTLKGVLIPADSSEPLNQYAFRDDYDQEHDEYKGVYRVIAETDFTLNIKDKDGKVETVKIAKGDDITKYTTHKHDVENGVVTIDFTKDFYDAFDNKSEFQASVELMMTRIKDGEVYNTFDNIVNGVTVLSNKVKTTTPKPNTPTPNTPAPTKEVKTLPTTGEQSSIVATVLGSILGLAGLVGLKRKKN